MSAIFALLLMQATTAEWKEYPSAHGFWVAGSSGYCALTAEYNGGISTNISADKDSRLYLIFSQKNWNPVAEKRYNFKIDFGDEYYDLTTVATESGSFVTSLHPAFLDSYAGSKGVEITWGSKSIATLSLAGSSKAIAALRLCMKEKGIVVTAPPAPEPVETKRSNDPFDLSEPAAMRYYFGDAYPAKAGGSEGVVRASLKIGTNGRVLECIILEGSGSAILDAAACKGLQKSSFKSAKDRAGQAIESVMEHSVRFEDPNKTVEPR